MVAHTSTVAFQGIDTTPVSVQVQLVSGLPNILIVGLPDKAVGESKERVRAALQSLGLALPPKRIVINLAPADLLKEGSHYDLPIAIGLLVAMGVLPQDEVAGYVALGELSLDGALLPVAGVLPAAMQAIAENKGIICPEVNGGEAAWAGNEQVLAPSSLLALINHFKGTQVLSLPECMRSDGQVPCMDMREVRGQQVARRALEVAAAGGHNLLRMWPINSGF